ncbi:MAG: transporter substrate-binding domain-containing protein [Magnetococcus sp. MYC-9]
MRNFHIEKSMLFLVTTPKHWQVIMVVVGALLGVFCFSPWVSSAEETKGTHNILRVGSELDFPPFAVVNEHGEPDGFSVDLFKAVAQVMGVGVHFRVGRFDEIRSALERGEIDALPLVSHSEEREKVLDFTPPHTVSDATIFVRTGDKGIDTEEELRNHTIVVMRADGTHDYLLRNGIAENLLLVGTVAEALKLLASGKGDFALLPRLTGLLSVKELGLENIHATGPRISVYGRGFGFAVRKGDFKLQALLSHGLSIVKATGQYDQIYAKWFGLVDPKTVSMGTIYKYAGMASLGFLLVLMVSTIWGWSLRREVQRRRCIEAALVASNQELLESMHALRESHSRWELAVETQRAADARYERAVNAARDGIWEWTVNTDNNYLSPRWKQLLGYQDHELPNVLASFVDQLHPDDAPRVWGTISRHLKEQQPYEVEMRLRCKNGEYRWFHGRGQAEWDEQGHPLRMAGAITDITETKLVEKELRQAKDDAEKAAQAKSDFMATMSHEIRTPLNVVLGVLELLKESDLEQSHREHIQMAFGSGKMLLNLINDILDFSKIEADQLFLDSVHFNLSTLLDEVAMLMAPLAHAKHIELVPFFPKELPVSVAGDQNRLRQIFTNLIGNAIKFTPQGGLVEFHGGLVNRANGQLEFLFEIRDTGIGIQAADREHIFERFVQANTSTTRQYGGTGLGLAICQRLVHLMGGQIGVDENIYADSGSIFYFTVQLQEQISVVSDARQSDLSGLRVLIVGSRGLQLSKLHNALNYWGVCYDDIFEPMMAFAEVEKAAQQGEHLPSLLIINQWPGQGIPQEWIARFIAEKNSIFLLLIDSLDRELEQSVECLNNTFCLKKPFSADQLHSKLCTVLNLGDSGAHPLIRPEPLSEKRVSSILIVDDQADNLIVALGMLAKIGYDRSRCMTARDGQQAIQRFKEHPFDLVIMDCQMPVMDGYQATRLIRQWEAEQGRSPTPIIALTADVTRENQEKGKAAGMDDFLSKPASLHELQSMLDSYLSDVTVIPDTLPGQKNSPHDDTQARTRSIIENLESLGVGEADLPELAHEMMVRFAEILDTLESDLRNKVYVRSRAMVHILRGSMLNTVLPDIQYEIQSLQNHVRGDAWDKALQQLDKVRMVYTSVQEVIAVWLAHRGHTPIGWPFQPLRVESLSSVADG